MLEVPTEQDPFPPLSVFVTFTSNTRVAVLVTKTLFAVAVSVTAFKALSTDELLPEKVILREVGFAIVTPAVVPAASES